MKKRHLIKVWIVLVVVWVMSFSDCSFAADNNMDLLKEVAEMLDLMVSIMAWIWVFLAKWAWELLTNNWVYWEILWLDAILWKYRNLVKNFANFGLWLYFLYEVFKWLTNGAEKIKDKLVRLLIAWVWIQSSWFLTAAVVDLSTITLATAGSFPATIVSDQEEVMNSVADRLNKFLKDNNSKSSIDDFNERLNFWLFSPDMWASSFIRIKTENLEKPVTKEQILDELLPNSESLSGPLYYLWFSILKTTKVKSATTASENWWMSTIFNTILQWGTTIIYCLEMLVLFILAFMRVLYMWLFIVLSPIAVLLWCLGQSGGLWSLEKKLEWLTKHVNFSSFFWNAFKPTLIALGIWLSMIFVSMMSSMISGKSFGFNMKWMTVYDYSDGKTANWNDWDKKYTTVMDSDMMELSIKNVWKTTSDFILAIVTLILVYLIIRIAANMWSWGDFVSKTIKKVQGTVEAWIGSVPLIPVSWYDANWNKEMHHISLGKTFGFGNNSNSQGLIWSGISILNDRVKNEFSDEGRVNELWWWTNSTMMSASNWNRIESAWRDKSWLDKLGDKRKAIDSQKTEKGWWFMLDPAKWDSRWIKDFTKWLNDTKGDDIKSFSRVSNANIEVWKKMVEWWKIEDNQKKSLKDMFDDIPNSARAYAEFFGLENITGWEDLKDEDISKTKSSEKK